MKKPYRFFEKKVWREKKRKGKKIGQPIEWEMKVRVKSGK